MWIFWVISSLCLAIHVDAQCRDIASKDQRALMIGQQVCFQCPLTGSTFSWTFLDTTFLPEGAEGFANGTLVINSVAQVHLDPSFFRCVADGVESDRYRLVEASISPPTFASTDRTVNESTDVTVFCTSSARPTPHMFQWTYEGRVLSSNAELQLNNVQRNQTGVYTCTTTNVVGTASANITLTVQFDSQCRDIASEDQRALIIGQQVCFQCPLTGSNFSWTFLDTPILPEGAEGFANGTLVINGVAQDHLDPAFFRCVADGVQSDPYRLVEASISPPSFALSDRTVNESTNVTVFCTSSASPTPHMFQWTYEGRVLSNTPVLQLNNVQRNQTGVYTCTTTNVVGTASANITLTVQFPPYAPTGLNVTGVTTTSFQLTWTNPFSGNSDLSTATVTLTSVNDSTTLQADTLTSHHFEGLVPNQDYQVEVVVSNTVGPSPPGNTSTRTLPLAPAQPIPFTVTPSSSTQLLLRWMPPPNDTRVTPITSWVVLYRAESSSVVTEAIITNPSARQYPLTNLMKGTLYVVRLAGVNSAGRGSFTDEMSQRTMFDNPSEPLNLRQTLLNPHSANIRWDPSADSGGSPLLNYQVELRAEGEAGYSINGTVSHPTVEYQLALEPETTYMVRVSARNMELLSYGPPSDAISFTTPQLDFPPASGIPPLFSELTDTSVTISFEPLVGVVTVYIVEYHLERLTTDSARQEEVLPTNEGLISTTIRGLAPDSPYLFRYFSRNELVESAPSPYLKVVTASSVTINETSPSEMTEGSDIVLECLFDNGRPAENVTWLFEDQPVSQLGGSNVQQNGHRLTIDSATVGNSGEYLCRYVRGDGAVAESRTEVNIRPAVSVWKIQLHLRPVSECTDWVESGTDSKLMTISDAVSVRLQTDCSCSVAVRNPVFSCANTADSKTVVFLAELQYSAPAEVDVPSLLTSWVSSGPVITVNSIQLQVNTTSPVVIDSMQAQSYSEATVIAAAVGVSILVVVIITTVVIVTACALVVLYWKRSRYMSRCKHHPSNSVCNEYSTMGSGSGGVTMENMTNNPSYTTSREAITSFTTGTPTDHNK